MEYAQTTHLLSFCHSARNVSMGGRRTSAWGGPHPVGDPSTVEPRSIVCTLMYYSSPFWYFCVLFDSKLCIMGDPERS